MRRERTPDRDLHAEQLGQPLDPRGEVHRVADQRIGQALRRPHIPDAARPGIQPNPDLDITGPVGRIIAVERRQPFDHRQTAARGIGILVRIVERRVPERDDRVADELVDRRLAVQQNVAHRRQERDQEADDGLRIELFRQPRETANVAEQHGHLTLFAAEFELPRIVDDPLDHVGRKIAVERAVDIGALPLLAIIGPYRLDRINRRQPEDDIGRIEQKPVAPERIPAAIADAAHQHRAKHRPAHRADQRQRQHQNESERQQQRPLQPHRPIGPHEKFAEHHLLDRLGMDHHAQFAVLHRRGNKVAKPRRPGTDQHDPPGKLALHFGRRQLPGEDLPRGHHALWVRGGVIHPQLAGMRRRDFELPGLERNDLALPAIFAARIARFDRDRPGTLRRPQGVERQCGHQLIALKGNQRGLADDPVGIADQADEAAAARRIA